MHTTTTLVLLTVSLLSLTRINVHKLFLIVRIHLPLPSTSIPVWVYVHADFIIEVKVLPKGLMSEQVIYFDVVKSMCPNQKICFDFSFGTTLVNHPGENPGGGSHSPAQKQR